jgi:hypothetical protein
MSDQLPAQNGKALAVPKRASTGLYVRASAGIKLRDRLTTRLVRKMFVAMPWLEEEDRPAARAWAQFEYLSGQVYAVLRAGSVVNAAGEGKRLLDDYRKLRLAQAVFARELGMTPAARMAIKADGSRAAFDLPAEMLKNVTDIGESRAAERAVRAQEDKNDG